MEPRDDTVPAAPRRPPWLRSVLLVVVPALLLVGFLAAGSGWLIGTSAGLRVLLTVASWAMPSLSTRGVEGTLTGGFTIERLRLDEPRWALEAMQVVVTPQELSWRSRLIDLQQLTARSVKVQWTSQPSKEPAQPPQSLALPFDLTLRDVRIAELALGARDATPTVLNDVQLAGAADRTAIRITRINGRLGPSAVAGEGHIDAAPPFALSARAQLQTVVLERPMQAAIETGGALADLTVTATSNEGASQLSARARVTPFAPVPLAALNIQIAQLEPQLWLPSVPVMRLSGTADLQPRTVDGALSLEGPFSISNALAGPIDRQRIPVQAARGKLIWSPSSLALTIDALEGAGGSARGTLVRDAAGRIGARAQLTGIDASRIHTALAQTQATGDLDYALDGSTQRFDGKISNARGVALTADFAMTLANDVLDIRRATLKIASGRADIAGRVTLGKATSAQLRGEFAELDLSQFAKGVDTRLNGKLSVDGTLSPVRRGHAEIRLSDSRIAGHALQGHADVRINGDVLDLETELHSGAASLIAKGGLGTGRELSFDLNAPQLTDLTPTVGGSVTAHGTVSGTLQALTLVANATASDLALPNKHRIAKSELSIHAGTAASAPLDVAVTLIGHRAPDRPDLSLTTASLTARGTTASHAITFDATTATREPVSLRASGGWQTDAWRGSVTTVAIGKPLELRLDSPAALTLGANRITFGPTAFTARQTHFTEVELTRADGRLHAAGNFSNMQPQALDSRARAPRRTVRTSAGDTQPLTLAGRWSLDYTSALSGIVVVERTAGDLYSGVDAVHPIGISDIGAALNIVDNRVTGTAYLRGRALGKVDASIDAWINPAEFRLAQDRRFRVTVDAALPDLGWMGPLISDTVQIEGAATVNAVIGGTPADPTADGKLAGRNLRLVWIEQGLRLENGTLDAGLEDGVLVLNEMVFTGQAREKPVDKRAMTAVNVEAPGTVRVVGRIALQTLTGSIGVHAEHLPIMQRSERWMVVSGEGGITLTPTRAELYAKPIVDGAYIDFASLRGPRTLPADVVVVRADQQARSKDAAAPVEVQLNVEARLGQRFYIRGAGLEARLAGAVTVTGRPSQLNAIGNVRIVDGIYNGYGQRLQIERGVVTFSGPLENPALNVLATRPNLPVEVGVQISGTALAPSVRLYSDTAMSDVEKLNWLVLGRPPSAADSQDRAMLTAAASALFAGQSDSASSNVLRSVGLDEFGLRTGGQSSASLLPRETVAGTLRSGSSSASSGDFVALGKRISDDLYVTFEQALTGAEYYVALNYQLTRRISVIARAGSTNAIDLVYSLTFDRWSEAFAPEPERRRPRTAPPPTR